MAKPSPAARSSSSYSSSSSLRRQRSTLFLAFFACFFGALAGVVLRNLHAAAAASANAALGDELVAYTNGAAAHSSTLETFPSTTERRGRHGLPAGGRRAQQETALEQVEGEEEVGQDGVDGDEGSLGVLGGTVSSRVRRKKLKESSDDRARLAEVCGNWQENCARRHAAAMQQLRRAEQHGSMEGFQWEGEPPRFVVFRCRQDGAVYDQCGGLADRLAGIVSTLAFALVTNRTFLIDWPGVSNAFTSPYIDFAYTAWTVGGPQVEKHMPPMPPTKYRPERAEVVQSMDKKWAIYNWHDCEVRRRGSKNCGGIFNGHMAALNAAFTEQTLIFGFNKGVTGPMFDLQATGDILRSLGLKRETIFGCLLHYLVSPTQPVRERFANVRSVMEDPYIFTIGIHIRTGDDSFTLNRTLTLEDTDPWDRPPHTKYSAYFNAALALEQKFTQPGQRVIWFLISDSEPLKRAAEKAYGSKILTTDIQPAHVDKAVYSRSARNDAIRNLQEAVGEWWLFSKADYFVMKRYSGFSRTAWAYALKLNSAINPDYAWVFTEYELLASSGAGL
eukprot:jgi/Chlat1/2184/Chrsp17S02747